MSVGRWVPTLGGNLIQPPSGCKSEGMQQPEHCRESTNLTGSCFPEYDESTTDISNNMWHIFLKGVAETTLEEYTN